MLRLAVLGERAVHVDLWSAVLGAADATEFVFGATDVADLVRCSDDGVNVVVVDVALGPEAMARVTGSIERRWPEAALVVADADVDLPTMMERVRNADPAITLLTPGALQHARGTMRTTAKRAPVMTYPRLTDRERAVLESLSRGNSTAAIAADLQISVNTCRGYLRTLMAKLGARSQVEVLAYVAEHGLPDQQ
jgi:DNA-binding CsgD family transcriptional regulator